MRSLRDKLNNGTRVFGNKIHSGLGNYLTRDVNLKKSFRNVAVGASMLVALATGTYTIMGNACCDGGKETSQARLDNDDVSDDDSYNSGNDDNSFWNGWDDDSKRKLSDSFIYYFFL